MHSLTSASNGRWSQHHNMSLSVHMHVDDSYLLSTISHAQRWSQSCAIQLPIFHIAGYAVLCHDVRCAARWRPVPRAGGSLVASSMCWLSSVYADYYVYVCIALYGAHRCLPPDVFWAGE